jgi:hypothetical protein
MSRQLEAHIEERQAKRHASIIRAIEFELVDAVQASGREILGFSVKIRDDHTLMVIKAEGKDGPEVAFVGGDDVGSVLIKGVRECWRDELRWQPDKWVRGD